jgi:hypothetical protein
MDRKSIGKRVRFEVFKRDSFTCQYCGQKAPEVVLEVDHISPVAGGGSDDIVNLVTACRGCNAGKSDKRLSDSSAVEKSRAQAEDIQERRRQLEKLWLECIDSEPGVCLTDKARDSLRKACKSFGFDAVCAMIVEVAGKLAERGEADEEVARNKAFWSIARILGAKKADEGDPGISRLLYIRGILRNRLNYVNERDCVAMLREARDAGINVDWLEWHAKRAFSWSRFRDIVSEALRETYEAGSEGDGDGTDS